MSHSGNERDATACACAAKLDALHDKSPDHGPNWGLVKFVEYCNFF